MSERKSARPQDSDWDDGAYVRHDEPAISADSDDASVSGVDRPPVADDVFRDEGDDENIDMSVAELLYSTSSFYAIVIPGMIWIFI